MSSAALAIFVRLYTASGDRARWQNYYVEQTVDGYEFMSFTSAPMVTTVSSDENSIGLVLPPLPAVLRTVESAINEQWLAEAQMYELESGVKTLVATTFGVVLAAAFEPGAITLEMGMALDALTAQVPGRRFTTALIGNIPKNL